MIPPGKHDTVASYHDNTGLQIEYPEVATCATTPQTIAAEQAIAPLALEDPSTIPTFDMTLEEAIQMAVEQSPVLRTVGETLAVPFSRPATIYDPALVSASPVLGTEAALSAFDAQYTQQLFWEKVDRPQNRRPFNAGPFVVASITDQNLATFSGDLSKTTAQGARFALRHIVNYSNVNDPSVNARLFPSSFEGYAEAEWRQPLMQGAGTTYNRIAGPNSQPGQYNGVLIARVNEDVALADFETSLIQLVSDVEQAYWDLTTAYRILNVQVKGREAAQFEYQFQQSRFDIGAGSPDELAQATSQFFLFQAQVEQALGGAVGLYAQEQRLRYLLGMTATDGRLIRPSTPPLDLKVVFDWEDALAQALDRRVEIRRQRFEVRRVEMELIAARLNLRPRLDLLAQYRWRGLGNHLLGDTTAGVINPATGTPNLGSNLYGSILGGDYQELQAGFELSFPVGLRAASTAVAHARLGLRREQALLAETELHVSHVLSEAARQVELTHQLMETNYNRFAADMVQADVLEKRKNAFPGGLFIALQAQRQVVNSAGEFYRSLSEYNLAIRDFHREKGSLLAYNQVLLAEGPWAAGSAEDAYHVGRFLTPRIHPEKVCAPRPISSGIFNPSEVQNTTLRRPFGIAA